MPPTFDETYAWSVLTALCRRTRPAGSPGEAAAAAALRRELERAGLRVRTEPFPVPVFQPLEARVVLPGRGGRTVEAAVVGRSGNTPREGVRGRLVHWMAAESAPDRKLRGAVVLTAVPVTREMYQRFRAGGVRALIQVSGPGPGIARWSRGPALVRAYGALPSVTIRYEDAVDLLAAEPGTVRVVARQRLRRGASRNVVAELPGGARRAETLLVCAHYDSVAESVGALDNAGGAATLVALARACAAGQRPARTLRFVLFGGEEQGLLGSRAYARRHARALAAPAPPVTLRTPRVRLALNLDMAGATLGANGARICGCEAAGHYVEALARETGLPLTVSHEVWSSDNIPLNQAGVPSISLFRAGGNTGHTPLDQPRYLSPAGLGLLGRFAAALLDRLARASEFPFDGPIPDADREAVLRYVERSDPTFRRP